MTKNNIPETALEAIRHFGDMENCHNFLVSLRWGKNGIECPHCGSKEIGKLVMPRRLWNCKTCKRQFTAKVGTIFEDSPLGLDKWIPAVWLIVNAKNGISSCELARSLGVTQKTAWHMGHRIRKAVHAGIFKGKLKGTVEVDETFIGGKARFMHKNKLPVKVCGPVMKTAVQGLLERHSTKGRSRVRLQVIPSTRRRSVQMAVLEHVTNGTEVMTDALKGYNGLHHTYNHQVIDHAESYVDGAVHTNGLENFWTLLKRSLKGTYVHCAPFHLHRYLDEQAYRFNERSHDDSERFMTAMRKTPTTARLTYRKLTGK
jgi:transposase-like protein